LEEWKIGRKKRGWILIKLAKSMPFSKSQWGDDEMMKRLIALFNRVCYNFLRPGGRAQTAKIVAPTEPNSK
jgi:hypothetical protein